jgi:hypothetical protein
MTLKTNWGNDVLNAYAEQINELEAQGNRTGAPAKYGKDLENWFNQLVKDTRDSSGGKSTSGSSGGGGSTTEGGRKAGSSTAGGSTPGSSAPGSSGGKAGSSGGGTPGSSSGGTPGSGTTAGSGSGGPGSGGSNGNVSIDSVGTAVTTIGHIGGPGAAATVQHVAVGGGALAGVGAVGQPVADAIATAGERAAQVESGRPGATQASVGKAAVDGANDAARAVQAIKDAGGSAAQQAAVAKAVAEAAQYGGADAAAAVADAAAAAAGLEGAAAGVSAAQTVAGMTKKIRQYGFSAADAARIARAMANATQRLGLRGAEMASNTVNFTLANKDAGDIEKMLNGSVATLAESINQVTESVGEAMLEAKNDGGPDAANAVLDAAVAASATGGEAGAIAAAEAVADVAKATRSADFSKSDAAKVAKTVSSQVKNGGAGAGQAASNGAKARLKAIKDGEPGTINDVVTDATHCGQYQQAAVQAIKNNPNQDGSSDQEQINLVTNNMVALSALGAPVAKLALDGVLATLKAGGDGLAGRVYVTTQSFVTACTTVEVNGGTELDIEDTASAVASSAGAFGASGAQRAADAVTNATKFDDNAHTAVGAAKAMSDALVTGKKAGLSDFQLRDLGNAVSLSAKGGGAAGAQEAVRAFERFKPDKLPDLAINAAQEVGLVEVNGGPQAGNILTGLIQQGDLTAVDAIATTLLNLKAAGGSQQQLAAAAKSLYDAYSEDGSAGLSKISGAANYLESIGGNAQQILDSVTILSEDLQG